VGRLVLALTWLLVSASLLICSVAAAGPPTPGPTDASVGTLQSTPVPPASINPPLVPPAAQASTDDSLSEVVVEAPEPRYAAPTLRDRIGRVWAPVLINGRGPYRLVLDTGASHSAIVAQVADSLGIPVAQFASIRVTGVTGSAIVPSIAVDRLEVGELSMDSTVLPIVADVFGGAQGVLGTEGLADKRILIDFGRDRVLISRSRGELDRHGVTTLPLRQLHEHLLALDVHVGDVRAKAVIDTGAQVSIGNLALRELLAQHGIKDARRQEIEGVTLDIERGDMIRAPPILVGTLKFTGVNITYGDMYIFDRWRLSREPTLVLGMDVLGTVDMLVIDYRLHELQIRLRHSPQANHS
jgi:predicted aspartyl protease